MREFRQLVKAWNMIQDGSVQCELYQEKDLVGILITPDTMIIDIKDPEAVELLQPFFRNFMESKTKSPQQAEEGGSLLLGLLGAVRAKRMDLNRYLSMVRGIAELLAEDGKTLVLMQKGKQLAKLGSGTDSLGLRLLNLKHVEVNDLSALMALMEKARSG